MPKAAAKQNKGLSLGKRKALVGWSFILPNFIGFFVLVLLPILFSFVLSFTDWNGYGSMNFVGLKNFFTIFGDKYFLQALGRTLLFTVFSVVVTTFCSLGLAVLLNKGLKGTAIFRSAIFFPYVASIVAVGVVWNMMFQPDFGPINELLRAFGIADPPGWFASTKWAIWAVIIVNIWKHMGYYMIVYLAALQDVPTELYEAATIDGANRTQYFWRIVWPTILPSTFFVIMMLTINSFKSLDLVFVLTNGGPGQATTLVANYIYNKAFVSENYGVSSAAAIVLFAIVAVITFIQFRVEKKWDSAN